MLDLGPRCRGVLRHDDLGKRDAQRCAGPGSGEVGRGVNVEGLAGASIVQHRLRCAGVEPMEPHAGHSPVARAHGIETVSQKAERPRGSEVLRAAALIAQCMDATILGTAFLQGAQRCRVKERHVTAEQQHGRGGRIGRELLHGTFNSGERPTAGRILPHETHSSMRRRGVVLSVGADDDPLSGWRGVEHALQHSVGTDVQAGLVDPAQSLGPPTGEDHRDDGGWRLTCGMCVVPAAVVLCAVIGHGLILPWCRRMARCSTRPAHRPRRRHQPS